MNGRNYKFARRMCLGLAFATAGFAPHAFGQCGTAVIWHDGGGIKCFAARPDRLLTGDSNFLRVYDVTNPSAPVEQGRYILDGYPWAVVQDGNFAFAALGARGVEIINITNPAAPAQAFSIAGGEATDLAVVNGRLTIAWNGLVRTYDVTNPASPAFVGSFNPGFPVEFIEARGNFVYAICDDGRMAALNYSNAAAPTIASTYDAGQFIRGSDLRPGLVALLLSSGRIDLVDISAPGAIAHASTVTGLRSSSRLLAFGQASGTPVVYFESNSGQIDGVSLANPAAPAAMPAVGSASQAFVIAATNDGKVFSDREGGLEVSTVTLAGGGTLASREELLFRTPSAIAVVGAGLAVVDDSLLRVYSLANPAVPAVLSDTPLPAGDVAGGAWISGTRAYVTTYDVPRLLTYNLSNPASPTLLGESPLPDSAPRLVVEGSLAYAYSTDGVLRVFDVSVPGELVQLGSFATGAASNADLRLRADGLMAVKDVAAVRLLNVTNPAAISQLSQVLPTAGSTLQGAEFVEDVLYTLEQPTLLSRYDLSTPAAPVRSSTFSGFTANHLTLTGGTLIASSTGRDDLASILDVSDPLAPVLLPQTLRTASGVSLAAGAGNRVYASITGYGLEAYRMPGSPRVKENPVSAPLCGGGGTVTFRVVPEDATGATYQWRRAGLNLPSGVTAWGTTVSGTTTDTLTLAGVGVLDVGAYDCVITNGCGSTTSADARLFLGGTPAFARQPAAATPCPSGPAVFSAAVNPAGGGTVTYQWEVESAPGSGVFTPVQDAILPRVIIGGARTATLRIVPRSGRTLPTALALRYRCAATNACGTTTSTPAGLTICAADFNCDGFVDGFDYDSYVACFEGDPCPPGTTADFNGDGFPDAFDYDDFVTAFEIGC